MARKFVTPMGRHKPLGSSWQAMDYKAYTYSYQPETRPEFRVYVTGQADACQRDYDAQVKRDEELRKIDEELSALADLDLLSHIV